MFCGKCGHEIAGDNVFCTNCGAQVQKEQVEQSEFTPTPVGEAPKKSKKGLLFSLIGGGAALIALVVILCFSFCGSKWALEPGMTEAEVTEALTDEGFAFEDDFTRKKEGEKYKGKLFNGTVEGIGKVKLQCMFWKGRLCGILVSSENKRAENFFKEEFGKMKKNSSPVITVYLYENNGVKGLIYEGTGVGEFCFTEYMDEKLGKEFTKEFNELKNQ